MPIEGRTLPKAARKFRDHLNEVLAKTITPAPLALIIVRRKQSRRAQLAFRIKGQARATEANLQTRFGTMGLYIGQTCGSFRITSNKQRLMTHEYKYMITPEGAEEALWRWEYVKDWPEGAEWCRHHLQGDIRLDISGQELELDDVHLPTGYVTIEEIIRFCIVDLGVKPLTKDWHQVLEDSYQTFKDVFSPRGSI